MRYITVDGTVWPVDTDNEDGYPTIEWLQRYGTAEERDIRGFATASILHAYGSLINSDQPMTDAIAKLRRARQADRQAR